VTAWSIVGFTGSGLFASRWLLQLLSSKRAGRPVVTWSFWAISMCGSLLQVAYFGLGPHFDEVGLLGNALPLCTAGYNLFLCWKLSRLASGGPLSIAAPLSENRLEAESVGPSSASA
jgi:lipid-A-disaccharide synthase-like uncharacterized protein